MANNCQVPTPPKYVDELLDYVGYTHELYNKSVLENSCGEGNILKEIVRRYITSSLKDGYNKSQIINGLERSITGYDVDPLCIEKCIETLDRLALEYGLKNIHWNIKEQDYLKCEPNNYHFIIGNPPYITYHDLPLDSRTFVKEKYNTCKEGRFDYCYAFIEAGIRDLAPDGKLAYIVPYGVIRNKYAERVRALIKKHLAGIIDYKGIQLFPNTVTSSLTILCTKQNDDDVVYFGIKDNIKKRLPKSMLNGKWIFDEEQSYSRRFGDYFKISNSVATLCNEAFVFEANEEDELFYYLENGKIEKKIVFDAASTKSEKKYKQIQKRDKIIFPYKIVDGKALSFREEEFKHSFPECYAYLEKKKKYLLNRKSSEGVKWYEYGRVQAINNIFEDKLIMSVVITNSVNVYCVGNKSIPYAGIFIKAIKSEEMTLDEAKVILQSDSFLNYVKKHGTPTTTSSYRISVKDIDNYYF